MGLDPTLVIGLFYWLRLAGLAALLGFAIFRARRRWLNGEPGDQAKRIIFPWLAIVLGFAIYMGVLTIFLAPTLIFYLVPVIALWVVVPALVSVAVLDFGAKLLQAERSGFWLGAALIAYVAVMLIWLGIFGLGPLLVYPGLWLEYLALATIPATAAISWWSFLPGEGGRRDIAETFD